LLTSALSKLKCPRHNNAELSRVWATSWVVETSGHFTIFTNGRTITRVTRRLQRPCYFARSILTGMDGEAACAFPSPCWRHTVQVARQPTRRRTAFRSLTTAGEFAYLAISWETNVRSGTGTMRCNAPEPRGRIPRNVPFPCLVMRPSVAGANGHVEISRM
jgi:hypothetical protein